MSKNKKKSKKQKNKTKTKTAPEAEAVAIKARKAREPMKPVGRVDISGTGVVKALAEIGRANVWTPVTAS